MKKRLRFQLPHVPLKVLRGEQDQEDIQDTYYERFQAPGTTTEDAEDDEDTDDDSRISNDDVATDIGEVSEEGVERYLGKHTDSFDTVMQLNNENQDHQNKNTQDNPEYDTTGSIYHETAEVEAVAQVHHLPDSYVTSNDDTENLLTNMY